MSLGPRGAEEEEPAFIRDMILKSPDQLALLKHNNPQLADALLSGDLELFTRVLREQQKEKSDRDRQRIRMMNADPFDPETQRLIAEEIRCADNHHEPGPVLSDVPSCDSWTLGGQVLPKEWEPSASLVAFTWVPCKL
ncbi:hypothetical protein HPB49_022144 [Dermacentor silvarum]|uniref:Uncharacterized protein n=1 Tax=Dermacentor silvarum TaxID=543639 RepID=A0ACB8CHL8_DERSI|nr:hypothetical protein HPB49_022144 [Dermacentor silvarum]